MTELQDLRLLFTVARPEIQLVQTAGSEAGAGVSEQDELIPTGGDLPLIPVLTAAEAL